MVVKMGGRIGFRCPEKLKQKLVREAKRRQLSVAEVIIEKLERRK